METLLVYSTKLTTGTVIEGIDKKKATNRQGVILLVAKSSWLHSKHEYTHLILNLEYKKNL